jgi:hypothetical protein
MSMSNRKARSLLSRGGKHWYLRKWVRVSNRRSVGLVHSGRHVMGRKDKNSAAQNRWKNHTYRTERAA